MCSKIPVTLQHNRGFIYDVEGNAVAAVLIILNYTIFNEQFTDYLKLRFTHRIIGNLIGTPVSKPRNASSFGLPAVLTSFEVKLGIDEGIIELRDSGASLSRCPSEKEKRDFEALSKRQVYEQKEPVIEKRMSEFKRCLPKIVAGKRKKLLQSGVKEEGSLFFNITHVQSQSREHVSVLQISVSIPLSSWKKKLRN